VIGVDGDEDQELASAIDAAQRRNSPLGPAGPAHPLFGALLIWLV
jgi:hypothetical protein